MSDSIARNAGIGPQGSTVSAMSDQPIPKPATRPRRQDTYTEHFGGSQLSELYDADEADLIFETLEQRIAELEAENAEFRHSYNATVLIPKLRKAEVEDRRLREALLHCRLTARGRFFKTVEFARERRLVRIEEVAYAALAEEATNDH